MLGYADKHGKLVKEGSGGSSEALACETVGYLTEYLIFHVACVLLHDLPVVYTDGFNTYTDGFWDVRDSPCSDSNALCNVEAASQSSWNLKVLSSGSSPRPCHVPALGCTLSPTVAWMCSEKIAERHNQRLAD